METFDGPDFPAHDVATRSRFYQWNAAEGTCHVGPYPFFENSAGNPAG